MVGWHHRLDGREFEQTPGDGEGQGSLAWCCSWGRKVRCDLVAEQRSTGSKVLTPSALCLDSQSERLHSQTERLQPAAPTTPWRFIRGGGLIAGLAAPRAHPASCFLCLVHTSLPSFFST